jgi:two-component system, cell cycle response regulator DivK
MPYILLVEDDPTNADLIIRVLNAAGFEVKHTLRGLESTQIARKERPELILMDFDLPDIDGRTMVLLLKKQLGGNAAPPIVAVTARTGSTDMRMAAQFGCSAFVGKPFLPETLVNVVKGFLQPQKPTHAAQ